MSSLTRISDLDRMPYEVKRIAKDQWACSDYVVGEIAGAPHRIYRIELASGRMVQALPGDYVIGAFGNRSATLEGVGSWSDIKDDRMHAMTGAGLFGFVTSMSPMIAPNLLLSYRGHIVRNGEKVCMPDFAIGPCAGRFDVPTILLVGTSMSAGKTTTGRLIVHELEKQGKKVVGAKLTGAGRYRDILSFRDAGAEEVFDFVDAGLPSTVVPDQEFRQAIRPLLHHIDSLSPDIVVAEVGASPLEPYNVAAAIDELGNNIQCTILCASDPYAVVGVEKAFGLKPDLVTGPATSTSAAIDLVRKLSGVDALNVMDPDCLPALRDVLNRTLKL
jgi:dethiobiotin synthetase